MNASKVILERTRKQNSGYWATIRDADERAIFFLSVRGAHTKYSRQEVGDILNGLIDAIKNDRFETREVLHDG